MPASLRWALSFSFWRPRFVPFIRNMGGATVAMAAMLMVLVYNLADTFFIGQTHDDLQVAAVSLATPVFLLFMSVGTVFGIGGTSVISRALGEGRNDYAKKVCSFCMWSCVGVGILMSALFLLFMDPILSLIGASAETWAYAKNYLTIVSCSGPFVLIANCYSNIIRAEGQSGKAALWLCLRRCAPPYGLRLLIFLHPLGRALKNQNAAPTTPPCFSRWLRSSSLLFKSSYPQLLLKGNCRVKQKRQLSKAVFLVVRIRGLEPPPSCPD